MNMPDQGLTASETESSADNKFVVGTEEMEIGSSREGEISGETKDEEDLLDDPGREESSGHYPEPERDGELREDDIDDQDLEDEDAEEVDEKTFRDESGPEVQEAVNTEAMEKEMNMMGKHKLSGVRKLSGEGIAAAAENYPENDQTGNNENDEAEKETMEEAFEDEKTMNEMEDEEDYTDNEELVEGDPESDEDAEIGDNKFVEDDLESDEDDEMIDEEIVDNESEDEDLVDDEDMENEVMETEELVEGDPESDEDEEIGDNEFVEDDLESDEDDDMIDEEIVDNESEDEDLVDNEDMENEVMESEEDGSSDNSFYDDDLISDEESGSGEQEEPLSKPAAFRTMNFMPKQDKSRNDMENLGPRLMDKQQQKIQALNETSDDSETTTPPTFKQELEITEDQDGTETSNEDKLEIENKLEGTSSLKTGTNYSYEYNNGEDDYGSKEDKETDGINQKMQITMNEKGQKDLNANPVKRGRRKKGEYWEDKVNEYVNEYKDETDKGEDNNYGSYKDTTVEPVTPESKYVNQGGMGQMEKTTLTNPINPAPKTVPRFEKHRHNPTRKFQGKPTEQVAANQKPRQNAKSHHKTGNIRRTGNEAQLKTTPALDKGQLPDKTGHDDYDHNHIDNSNLLVSMTHHHDNEMADLAAPMIWMPREHDYDHH